MIISTYTSEKGSSPSLNILTMWQSCPPTSDEILSSLRKQFERLSEDYKELRRLNKELEDRLIQQSKNREFINSLKKQRTYLGKFNLNIVTMKIMYDAISPFKLILVQKIQRIITDFNNKISLVESECNIKTGEIDSLRLELNQYTKKLRKKQQNQNFCLFGFCLGIYLAAEAAILYFDTPAFILFIVAGAVGCLYGWCDNYFFADVKPSVTKINVVGTCPFTANRCCETFPDCCETFPKNPLAVK